MSTTMAKDLQALREDYQLDTLEMSATHPNPFQQFSTWMDTAQAAELPEPNAMTLATVGTDGQPSARIVLLKEVDERGFLFYTNYDSHKAHELATNPRVAVVFVWLELQRQVRIEGSVELVDDATSTAYFQSRPIKSQLGAWASAQSTVIPDREVLEQRMTEMQERFAGQDKLPKPPQWGGYRIIPNRFEFWQGRRSRLHDRIQYRPDGAGNWLRERLSP